MKSQDKPMTMVLNATFNPSVIGGEVKNEMGEKN